MSVLVNKERRKTNLKLELLLLNMYFHRQSEKITFFTTEASEINSQIEQRIK